MGNFSPSRSTIIGENPAENEDGNSANVVIRLHPLTWLCEASLWTRWKNCGVLIATGDTAFLALESDDLAAAVAPYSSVCALAAAYGRKFVEKLIESERFCDITDPAMTRSGQIQSIFAGAKAAAGNLFYH